VGEAMALFADVTATRIGMIIRRRIEYHSKTGGAEFYGGSINPVAADVRRRNYP
jgi:hypothetical protein